MLNEKQLAVLGGHFLGNEDINRFPDIISSLLKSYSPDYYDDTIDAFKNYGIENTIKYLNFISSTDFKLVERLTDIGSNALIHNSLSDDELLEIESILKLRPVENSIKTYTFEELQSHVKPISYYKTESILDSIVGTEGFHSNKLYVFAAPPKGGKSLLLQNLAYRLSLKNEDKKVLYISLENSADIIVSRQNQISPTVKYQTAYNSSLGGEITVKNIDKWCEEFDIICLDYLGCFTPNKEESSYSFYMELTKHFHLMADLTNTCIITAFQLNRSAFSYFSGNEETFLEDFLKINQNSMSESMGVCQRADQVITTMFHKKTFYFNVIASRIENEYDIGTIPKHTSKTSINLQWTKGGFKVV